MKNGIQNYFLAITKGGNPSELQTKKLVELSTSKNTENLESVGIKNSLSLVTNEDSLKPFLRTKTAPFLKKTDIFGISEKIT